MYLHYTWYIMSVQWTLAIYSLLLFIFRQLDIVQIFNSYLRVTFFRHPPNKKLYLNFIDKYLNTLNSTQAAIIQNSVLYKKLLNKTYHTGSRGKIQSPIMHLPDLKEFTQKLFAEPSAGNYRLGQYSKKLFWKQCIHCRAERNLRMHLVLLETPALVGSY